MGFRTWGGAAALAMSLFATPTMAASPVDFIRDVQPIIADKCFACHGPDASTRKLGLRLDQKEGLLGNSRDGAPIIAPGAPDTSVFFQRITHADPDERMPPASSSLELSAKDIDTLQRWIAEGAQWEGHWAFESPRKPEIPTVSNPSWCRNEIDYFILRKLEDAGLEPGAEAPKATLLRRVTLDLTGLPPTPEDVALFLADERPDAYERAVDRLLASPHYGERMAFPWLDAARYSDTNGYQRDTKRFMWAWRDWVIRAFNDNMPFDQFTIEQLAGDLLPSPTLDQRVATGFNRNHRINGEGGIIPEEYAVEYVVDRVDTTSTAWMGMTMGCARCHDHKFDPISQKEFYELYAFFNQVPEEGKGRERGNDVPIVEVPTQEEKIKLASLDERISSLQKSLAAPDPRLDALQDAWEVSLASTFASLAWSDLGNPSMATSNGAVLEHAEDGSFRASGPNPDQETYAITFQASGPVRAFKLDVLTDPSLPETGPGRSPNGNVVLSEFQVERAPADAPDQAQKLVVADAIADYAQGKNEYPITYTLDGRDDTGWATGSLERRENRVAIFTLDPAAAIAAGDWVTVRLKHTSIYAQHAMGRFRLSQSASGAVPGWARPAYDTWQHVGPFPLGPADNNTLIDIALPPESGFDPGAAYENGTLQWTAKPEFVNGEVHQLGQSEQAAQYLYRKFRTELPQILDLSFGSNDAIRVWVDGQVRLTTNVGRTTAPDQDRFEVFLSPGEHELLIKVVNYGGATSFYFDSVDDQGQSLLATMKTLAMPKAQRSEDEQDRLTLYFRGQDGEWLKSRKDLDAARQERKDVLRSLTTTMVMEDMAEKRDTYLLKRGAYDAPDTSEKLFPSVPARLGEMDPALPKNRLGLAMWLMDPSHPLTARVRVNHYWQMYFGRGIVKSSEDFGTQGTPPSHPQLLDWLALHFIESGWDVKAMQKYIVTSATYRQSSAQSPAQREKDPENLLLAHAPRFRLPAEMLRDQALSVSGLLSAKIGGPSVYPYQPEGMWSSLTFQNMDEFDTNYYKEDTGENLYRRGLYTYWKRTIAPPRMQIFDAADRERCSMYKPPTNTPMQALALLNDVTFVEAARHLAQRMILEGGDRSSDRIRYGYGLALADTPDATRQEVLLGGLSDYQAHFSARPEDASALLGVGTSDFDRSIPEAELAAYTAVASVLLNLDEIITRE